MSVDPQQIELNEEQKAQLARLAVQTGKPWSEVLSEALRGYHPLRPNDHDGATEESLYDALRRDGLIGIVKNAPLDLSTNPKYMEGFGSDSETGAD